MSDDIIKRLRGPSPSIPAMRDAANEIDRLRAENAALAADARRYRFIRDADRSDAFMPLESMLCYAMDDLDAAIDAAREAEK